MEQPGIKASREQILGFMTTEHFALQTARSATIAEANGRTAIYLSSVSSAVVALAFIGQVSDTGDAFFLFALVLFPTLFFLGIVTFDRVLQTGLADLMHAREINRIRHYYVEVAPEVGRYFVHSTRDDTPAFFHDLAIAPTKWQYFVSSAGAVNIINGVIAGVFAGLAASYFLWWPDFACAAIGGVVFVASVVAHRRFQAKKSLQVMRRLDTLFPTPKSDEMAQKAAQAGAADGMGAHKTL
ncbi:MAG TPA: hypothetical protein VGF58_17700 [Burkholderiales bacterium]|jgi:hypothetical protein